MSVRDPFIRLLVVLAAICGAALVLLAWTPGLDLDAAGIFYAGGHRFIGATPLGIVARYTAWALPFVLYAALLVAGIAGCRRGWGPSARSLMFLTFTLVVGPGVLVHVTLKEVSHRPRPSNVDTFGGADRFRPFTRFDGACVHNCAFPSGEMAVATWTLAPASLVPPPWRGPALAAAVMFAGATGLLRMAFGGHFLSDVCGAALIVILVILAGRALMLRGRREGARLSLLDRNEDRLS